MKQQKEFLLGATYKLKKKYIEQFSRTPRTVENYGRGDLTFNVGGLSRSGDAWDGNGTLIALRTERHMFKRVNRYFNKEKKPFKVGATYKLKKRFINSIEWTDRMLEFYGEKRSFEFTVARHKYNNDVVCADIGNEHDILAIALPHERHMFKRVDNK